MHRLIVGCMRTVAVPRRSWDAYGMSIPTYDTAIPPVLEYTREFIRGYTETVDAHYADAKTVISGAGFDRDYFPLYGRQLGVDLAVAVFYTQIDFYLFFLIKPDTEIVAARSAIADATSGFGREWVADTPDERRIQRVREYLGLEEATVLQPAPSLDAINVPGRNFIALDALNMQVEGHTHGVNFGNQAGARAESALPAVQELLRKKASQAERAVRYTRLTTPGMTAQDRGREFEKLWRDVLDSYGWKTKKFRIPGEENDFTAIYQGLHILGEVKWFDRPMNGANLREFLAKLDPRPQTIGLFISYSGVDEGARSVLRRAVNSKTVLIFSKTDIDKVMLGADPGPIFDEKLRNAYDYIFERPDEG
jgi:hypothetical protein